MSIPIYIICSGNTVWGLSPRRMPDPMTRIEVELYIEQFNIPDNNIIPVTDSDMFRVMNAYRDKTLIISNGTYRIGA